MPMFLRVGLGNTSNRTPVYEGPSKAISQAPEKQKIEKIAVKVFECLKYYILKFNKLTTYLIPKIIR